MIRFVLAAFALATLPGSALAHPTAYQGSTGMMGYLSPGMTDLEVNYSLRYWLAPSVQLLRYTEGTARPDYLLGKMNLLAHRWNGEHFQANVYLHGGGGYALEKKRGVYHAGITADIEDRRLYLLGQWDTVRSGLGTEVIYWKARAGFAPYLGDFDQIHSWLILEANRKSVGKGQIEIVPTLRIFYQNVLWEVGSSLGGEVQFNYIIHI
jgi:hypothetical protein